MADGDNPLVSTHSVKLLLEAQQSLAVTEGTSLLHGRVRHRERGHPVVLRLAIITSSTASLCLAAGAGSVVGAAPVTAGAGPLGAAARCCSRRRHSLGGVVTGLEVLSSYGMMLFLCYGMLLFLGLSGKTSGVIMMIYCDFFFICVAVFTFFLFFNYTGLLISSCYQEIRKFWVVTG